MNVQRAAQTRHVQAQTAALKAKPATAITAHPSWTVARDLVQVAGAGHTGAPADFRMANPPRFDGSVESGRSYIILDDVLTSGSTVNAMRAHIESGGGRVVAVLAFGASGNPQTGYGGHLAPRPEILKKLEGKFNRDTLTAFLRKENIAHALDVLTNSQARYLLLFASLDRARSAIAAATESAQPAGGGGIVSDDTRPAGGFEPQPPQRGRQDELSFARRERAKPDPQARYEQIRADFDRMGQRRNRFRAETKALWESNEPGGGGTARAQRPTH